MTTDNRTNEQIVDEAMSVQWGRGGWLAGAVVTALEAADRLVKPNETKSGQEFCFSEAQVEAAAKAIAPPGVFAPSLAIYAQLRDNYRQSDQDEEREYYRGQARAALEAAARAAQGAAPQAGGGAQEELQALRALIEERARVIEQFSGAGEAVEAEQRAIARSIRRDLEDHDVAFAAPVLPSSTVDEDTLAEVVRKSENAWQKATGPKTRHEWIARAVIASRAEWLNASVTRKEQGR